MAFVIPIDRFGDRPHHDSARSGKAPGGLFIHDDTHPRAAVVHVFGEATFAESAAFESMLVSVVRIGRPVVIDMRECTFMDCAAIGVLVRAAKHLADQLRLVILRSSQGYRILELTELVPLLHIFESIDQALAPLENAAPARRLHSV
ncbi:MAG TPA: STAS domain-containing protein [Candidatus Lustribacter sp.]